MMSDTDAESEREVGRCDCSPRFECRCNPTKERVADNEIHCKNCGTKLQDVCEKHRAIYTDQ